VLACTEDGAVLGATVRSLLMNWKEYENPEFPLRSPFLIDDAIVKRVVGPLEGLQVGRCVGS